MNKKNLRARRYKFRKVNNSISGRVDAFVKAVTTPGTKEYNEMKAFDDFWESIEFYDDGSFSIGNVPDYIKDSKPEDL